MKVFVTSIASCDVYTAAQNQYDLAPVSKNFAKAIELLDNNLQDYYTFIDNFGTHYVQSMKMGAKFGVISKFAKYKFAEMVQNNLAIDAAASVSAQLTSGIGNAKEDNNAVYFNSQRDSFNITSDGPQIPADGSGNTWHAEAFQKPSPIEYSLKTIDTLVSKHLSSKTDKRVINLQNALANYCDYLKSRGEISSCEEYSGVQRPVFMNTCRICANSCGNGYTEDGGTILADREDQKFEFKQFGDGCADQYGSFGSNHFKLCCQKHQPRVSEGECRLCLTCGGLWNGYGGALFRINDHVAAKSEIYDHSC